MSLADLDFDGTTETVEMTDDFDQWMNEMLAGEDSETVYYDAEDADWNENIFLDEDDEDETPTPVQVRTVEVKRTEPTTLKTRDAKACREWARANGYQIGNRGVIAQSIWDAYLAS